MRWKYLNFSKAGTPCCPIIYFFYLIYSLFIIHYSLIQRTLPYSMILWAVHASDWQLALLKREQQQPTTSAGVSPRTTTQATTRAQRTSASFALSASLPLRTFSHHASTAARMPQHGTNCFTLPCLKNLVGRTHKRLEVALIASKILQ